MLFSWLPWWIEQYSRSIFQKCFCFLKEKLFHEYPRVLFLEINSCSILASSTSAYYHHQYSISAKSWYTGYTFILKSYVFPVTWPLLGIQMPYSKLLKSQPGWNMNSTRKWGFLLQAQSWGLSNTLYSKIQRAKSFLSACLYSLICLCI